MRDFTKGSIAKQLVLFSLPMLLGNLFQQVYSLTDAVIVGRWVGGGALAAVGISSGLLNFLLSVLIGLATGASVVISQLYGAGRQEELRRSVSTSVIFMGALALAISLAGFLAAGPLLRLVGCPADVLEGALLYLRILMAGTVFPAFYNMYVAFLRALGDSRSPLLLLILSTVLNVGLDLLFVLGFGWGIAGAAWATWLSQMAAAVLCFLYANARVPLLRVGRLVLDGKLLRTIVRYSLPAAVQFSMTSLASLTILRLVNSFGYVASAGYTAATKIDQFAIAPGSNLSMAASTFVAQNIGAGQEERARKGLRATMALMCGVSVVIQAVALLFGRPLIGLFVDAAEADAAAIIDVGVQYFVIIVNFYILFSIFFAFNGFFRGVGDAVVVMALTITSLTIRAVAAHIMVHFFAMGPEAVAYSIPIGWGLCSLFALLYYKKGWWKGKDIASRRGANVKAAE